MTGPGFIWRLAWRQGHAARRRLILLTGSVIAGVGALVAVNSFSRNLAVAVAAQAQDLLGADLSIAGRQPAADNPVARRLVDSLRRVGGESVRVAVAADFPAMAYHAGSGGARLVDVRTADPGWPYYGTITTSPAGVWPELQHGAAIVDPSLLSALRLAVGDTIALGEARFRIAGTIVSVPGDIGLQLAFGARVFIATSAIPATRLLAFGSRAEYQTFLRLPPTVDARSVASANAATLRAQHLSLHTIAEDRDSLTRGLIRLGNYLGLVALAALLLGGLGVASAVTVFVRQQLDSIAVLRCLGATSWQLMAVQLLQALAMALIGSAIGALLGVGLQQLMPMVLRDFLPVDVHVVPSPHAILIGIACGVWTAAIFALLPVLVIRAVPPLATLRRDVTPARSRWDLWRIAATVVVPASVVGLAQVQVQSLSRAVGFAVACGVALAVLWGASRAVIAAARRWTPRSFPYLARQGLANLHRPANQTVTVVLALGFGAFILTTLFAAQRNLLRIIRVETSMARPNLVLIDIQPDQRHTIDSLLGTERLAALQYVPIVPMRIREIKGEPVAAIVARDSARRGGRGDRAAPWALSREFRSTYRDSLGSSEHVVSGRWFGGGPYPDGHTAASPAPISVESGVAKELGVAVGDRITWDVQGVPVYTTVTSLREVNWARFEPNFFVIFAPGSLERAPQTLVATVRADDPVRRGTIQREIAEHAANVTAIDLGEIQRAVEAVINRITLAIRFMALFSLITGAIVLIGSIATSRWQRVREGTLLRSLGATRAQVLTILCVEYAALGLAAALVASVLAGGAGWALARWVFDAHFILPIGAMMALAAGLVVLTTAVGLWNSLDILDRPPLEVLRSD